ncbi:hypothetical protein Lal_00001359 [Lupinus albus]|nr:hypothetical protein Lal_00001359 [Lupinus albus]
MLTIKRVATVVSNYQEDDSDKGSSLGCGRRCLSSCCLSVYVLLHQCYYIEVKIIKNKDPPQTVLSVILL